MDRDLVTTYQASGLPRSANSDRSFSVDAVALRGLGLSTCRAHAVKRGGKTVTASVTQVMSVSMMTRESSDHASALLLVMVSRQADGLTLQLHKLKARYTVGSAGWSRQPLVCRCRSQAEMTAKVEPKLHRR